MRSAAFVEGDNAKKASVAKPKVAKKPEEASKPKAVKALRAPSAFNLYYKAQYPVLKETSPGLKLPDANKALRAKWDALPEADKAPFLKEAAALKARVDATRVRAFGFPATHGSSNAGIHVLAPRSPAFSETSACVTVCGNADSAVMHAHWVMPFAARA